MTRWGRVLAALALVALATGCDVDTGDRTAPLPSTHAQHREPDRSLLLTGRLVLPDGSPAGGRPVLVERPPLSQGDVPSAGALLTCAAGEQVVVDACGPHAFTTTSRADGRFALGLAQADYLPDGAAQDLTLDAALPRGGGQLSARFRPGPGTEALPDLRFWRPSVSAVGATARVSALPGVPDVRYDLAWHSAAGLDVQRSDVGRAVRLDPRLLEDTSGVVVPHARARLAQEGRVTVAATWTAPAHSYASGAGAPLSRGVRCRIDADGATAATPDSCWLTDAQFATTFHAPAGDRCSRDFFSVCRSRPTTAELDLGHRVQLGLLVLRGSCSDCVVEGSRDHRHWSSLGDLRADGTMSTISPAGERARWVRVRVDTQSSADDLRDLTELSVWPVPGTRPDSFLSEHPVVVGLAATLLALTGVGLLGVLGVLGQVMVLSRGRGA